MLPQLWLSGRNFVPACLIRLVVRFWPTPSAAGIRPAGKLLRDKLPFQLHGAQRVKMTHCGSRPSEFAAMHKLYHLLRSHRTLTSSLVSMAPYPCVAVQKSKDVPLPSACQPYFAQLGCSVRLYFFPLHSRTFLLSSTRSEYVVPSTTSHPS